MVRFPWIRVSFFLLTCGFLAVVYATLFKQKQVTEIEVVKTVIAEPVATPPAIVEPAERRVSSGSSDTRKTSKGINLETKVTLLEGGSATAERANDDSYAARCEISIKIPTATDSLEGLVKLNPHLSGVLPDLGEMLKSATVSPYFTELYDRKMERTQSKSKNLGDLLTRHNIFDCETILNLTHPETGRRALLVQAEMDVVSDGSDGDRLPTMPENITTSSYYQPMTSYGWKKTGDVPNPLIAGWKTRIGRANAELALSSTSSSRRAWLKERIKKIEVEIADMENRSFLIADYDPFIVMPVSMVLTKNDSHMAKIGDYAVVIYKDKIYPAIVGDAGPSHKVGEASLRMCKQLDPSATPNIRPVSDLTVTYLVFPRSADKFQAPDYETWYSQCSKLLQEIGGLGDGVDLHQWESTFPVEEVIPNLDGILGFPKTMFSLGL